MYNVKNRCFEGIVHAKMFGSLIRPKVFQPCIIYFRKHKRRYQEVFNTMHEQTKFTFEFLQQFKLNCLKLLQQFTDTFLQLIFSYILMYFDMIMRYTRTNGVCPNTLFQLAVGLLQKIRSVTNKFIILTFCSIKITFTNEHNFYKF